MAEYIIVVDVDNVRAAKAYRKGYEDLLRLWPQIEAMNAVKAAESRKEWEADEALRLKRREEYNAALAEYHLASKAYEAWTPKLFGSERPPYPCRPYNLDLFYVPSYTNSNHDRFLRLYESIRRDLKHMMDVAEAATGPFRMTEHQITEMVRWEDGTRIDWVKKDVTDQDGP